MRLYPILCRYKKFPNGNIYTGKHRIVKPVTIADLDRLKVKLEIEEQNMFFLRHPYLTPVNSNKSSATIFLMLIFQILVMTHKFFQEQSFGHAKALGKHEAQKLKTVAGKKPFFDNVTVESRLAHLRVNETWD